MFALRCVILLLFRFQLSKHDSTVILRSQSRGGNVSLYFVGILSLLSENILYKPDDGFDKNRNMSQYI
jgi:hypothetical protein